MRVEEKMCLWLETRTHGRRDIDVVIMALLHASSFAKHVLKVERRTRKSTERG